MNARVGASKNGQTFDFVNFSERFETPSLATAVSPKAVKLGQRGGGGVVSSLVRLQALECV